MGWDDGWSGCGWHLENAQRELFFAIRKLEEGIR
jgi:hypothetical protein